MTLAETKSDPAQAAASAVPPLEPGDRLTAAEFLRRYEQMPEIENAELIEGIVHMASPVSAGYHGNPDSTTNFWLGYYVSKTPGLFLAHNSTTQLDVDNMPQPDLLMHLPSQVGGKARIDPQGYVVGPPELIVEIASSSASIDLNAKFNAYRRSGVGEYLIWRTREAKFDWFVLREGRYEPLQPDPADNLLKSPTFPGLWLDTQALLGQDFAALAATVDRGCKTEAHRAFADKLTTSR